MSKQTAIDTLLNELKSFRESVGERFQDHADSIKNLRVDFKHFREAVDTRLKALTTEHAEMRTAFLAAKEEQEKFNRVYVLEPGIALNDKVSQIEKTLEANPLEDFRSDFNAFRDYLTTRIESLDGKYSALETRYKTVRDAVLNNTGKQQDQENDIGGLRNTLQELRVTVNKIEDRVLSLIPLEDHEPEFYEWDKHILELIQSEVGEWSLNNFGENEIMLPIRYPGRSHSGPTTIRDNDGNPVEPLAQLGSLPSLLGIVEEIGELAEADCEEDIADAIGDILIYLCDFASRENVRLANVVPPRTRIFEEQSINGLIVPVGKLHHARLKRIQGIRGMDNFGNYCEARDGAIHDILNEICVLTYTVLETNPVDLLADVWEGVVAKRDWKVNAVTGDTENECGSDITEEIPMFGDHEPDEE